jgi:probable rRNA maturation factor
MISHLTLDIQGPTRRFSAHRALLRRRTIKRWIDTALFCPAQITVRFVGRQEGLALNHQYRGKPYATNVLSFSYDGDELLTPASPALLADSATQSERPSKIQGDIVLCCPVIEKEAKEQNKTLEAHYAHLIMHGVLHLQGYDHQNEDEAEVMEALETRLLAQLGFGPVY